MPSKKDYILNIAGFRAVGVFAVICIHTSPFNSEVWPIFFWLNSFIVQSCRFAVPFFFISSAYFFGTKVREGSNCWSVFGKFSNRILIATLLGVLFYSFLPSIPVIKEAGFLAAIVAKVQSFFSEKGMVVFRLCTASHLWFLPSLFSGVFLLVILSNISKKIHHIFLISILLYIFGLLGGPYKITPVGFDLGINTRNGPFFSMLFVAIGYYFSINKIRLKLCVSYLLFFLGYFIHLVEVFLLWRYYETLPVSHNFLIGTVLWSVGLFQILLEKDSILLAKLAKVGEYTLGIYVFHLFFVILMRPFGIRLHSILWELAFPFVVYFISFGFVWLVSQNKYLSKIVK